MRACSEARGGGAPCGPIEVTCGCGSTSLAPPRLQLALMCWESRPCARSQERWLRARQRCSGTRHRARTGHVELLNRTTSSVASSLHACAGGPSMREHQSHLRASCDDFRGGRARAWRGCTPMKVDVSNHSYERPARATGRATQRASARGSSGREAAHSHKGRLLVRTFSTIWTV